VEDNFQVQVAIKIKRTDQTGILHYTDDKHTTSLGNNGENFFSHHSFLISLQDEHLKKTPLFRKNDRFSTR